MIANLVKYPSTGCVVEFMQGNHAVQAWVLEESSGQVRLYTINKRELKLGINRLLPWSGPVYAGAASRQEIQIRLEEHRETRNRLAAEIDLAQLWELAQGEVTQAETVWFAELLWPGPDIDMLAAIGQAMLNQKIHFKFSPPVFEIYTADQVGKRIEKQERETKRQETLAIGVDFFKRLYEAYRQHKSVEPEDMPQGDVAEILKGILLQRISDPEAHDPEDVWKLLSKDIASKNTVDEPYLPFILAVSWGMLAKHHNYWLDRAEYDPAVTWADKYAAELKHLTGLVVAARNIAVAEVGVKSFGADEICYVSIDPASTKDWDDAIHVAKTAKGYNLSVALACPAAFWPFGSELDRQVLRRATSLYLPEGQHYMLPQEICFDLFSLKAGELRPAMLVDMELDIEAKLCSLTPRLGWVCISVNMSHENCEHLLRGHAGEEAGELTVMLKAGLELAQKLQLQRIEKGAVITERSDAQIVLRNGVDGEVEVEVLPGEDLPLCQLLVGEIMILLNHKLAFWARDKGIPLIYRTQNVSLPKEFAGVWNRPEDIARVVRALPPSQMGVEPKPHAGVGVDLYSSFTSPMRRYPDIINQWQVVSFLKNGAPTLTQDGLKDILPLVCARLDLSGLAQRYRPRYWKLLYFQQQEQKNKNGSKYYEAVVTEQNNNFVTFALAAYQISVRAPRSMLEEAFLGQVVQIRLGKINPLRNEIQVLEAIEDAGV